MDWRNTSKEAPTDFESKIYLLKISLYNQYLIIKTPYIIKYIKCCVFSEAGISINGLAKLSWCSPPPFPHTAWCLALVKWLLPAKLSSPAVGTYRLHPPLQEALMGRVHKPWWPCNWVTSNSKTSVPCVCVCVCVCVITGYHCCSVTRLCLTLCDTMDCSTLGFPVLHHLLEFPPTHVHWISDAIQPSHPLSSPSRPALKSFPASGSFPMCTWSYSAQRNKQNRTD